MHIPRRSTTGLLICLVSCSLLCGQARDRDATRRPARGGTRASRKPAVQPTTADVRYGAHERNVLDFYQARSDKPTPLALYIHGGGFTMGSKDTHRGIGLIYADRGHVVFNINYRLAPQYHYPAALEDTAAAYRWIIDNATAYGGDPGRMIVGGESAGGNLALALGVSA